MTLSRYARAVAVYAFLGGSAGAAGSPDNLPASDEPIHVAYAAAAGCPSAQELMATLRESTARFRLAAEQEPARSFSIEAIHAGAAAADTTGVPAERGYVGRLTIRDVESHVAVREVRGDTCREVVAAVAFIAALAIDSNAVPARLGASPSGLEPAAPVSPTSPASTAGPMAASPSDLPRPPSPSSAETRVFAAIRAGGVTGASPGVTAFARLAAEVSRVVPGSIWTASISLSIARGVTRDKTTPAGVAHLTWTTGRLDACVLRWAMTTNAMTGFELCPFLEAGVISGTATNTSAETPRDRGWFAPGALGRLSLEIAGPLVLEVEAGASAPIIRDHFYFVPGTSTANEVYQVPAVSFFADAGVGVRIR